MGAAYDSQERDPAPRCLPGTRQTIMAEIHEWVKAGVMGTSLLWLHGPAGAGKSAIAQTVAETCAERHQLAATFFFTRTVAGRNVMKYFFPTITFQIALSAPEKRRRLDRILSKDPTIIHRSSGAVDLLASLFPDSGCSEPSSILSSPFLVVIDGLDECHGHDDQCRILSQVSHIIHTHRLPLRFLVVSRHESHLREAFEEPTLASIMREVSLYGNVRARTDVVTYLRSEFSRICDSRRHRDIMESVPRPWPSDDAIQQIANKAGGYFIFPSMVIGFIDEEYFSPPERLGQVLNPGHCISSTARDSTPFAELDKLYSQILSSCPKSQIPLLKCILGHIVFDSWPRGIDHLAAFLRFLPGKVRLALRGLRSLVSFEGSLDPLQLVHASFGDFLLDEVCAGVHYIDSAEWYSGAFCDGFSLGVHLSHLSTERGSQSPQYLIDMGENLSVRLKIWFGCSPRIDPLVAFVHEKLEEGLWYSRFEDLGLSDEATLKVFDLLKEIICPESDSVVGRRLNSFASAEVLLPHILFSLALLNAALVMQHDECTPATQELLIRLRTLFDLALVNHLSKVADSPAKRDHLFVAHTIVLEYGLNSEISFENLSRCLDHHASNFPLALSWQDFSKYLFLQCNRPLEVVDDYLDKFLSNPVRSAVFHYDRARWYAFVATLSLRCLRTW